MRVPLLCTKPTQAALHHLNDALGSTISLWVIWRGLPVVNEILFEQGREGALPFLALIRENLSWGRKTSQDMLKKLLRFVHRFLARQRHKLDVFGEMFDRN